MSDNDHDGEEEQGHIPLVSNDIPVDEVINIATKLKDKGIILREVSITTQVGDLTHNITFGFDEEYEVSENMDIRHETLRGMN